MDSERYVNYHLKFIADKLGQLKPLKAMTKENLQSYAEETGKLGSGRPGDSFRHVDANWANEGSYFIQVMAYELSQRGSGYSFDSQIPGWGDKDGYVGGLMFPVGQLGIIQVISLFRETELEADDFTLSELDRPTCISDTQMFPPLELDEGNYCFGTHLVEDAYLVPDDVWDRVELMAPCSITEADYTKNVAPKSWTKFWIKNHDKYPVPGEFVGILIKPLPVPPHVWWFQETTPLLYAGNWVETQNLTSGKITKVTLEADRPDLGIGDEYWVKVNGIEFIAYASDFKRYKVDDRVAVLKRWTVNAKPTRSFSWKDQRDGMHPTENQVSREFVILPITFYKD